MTKSIPKLAASAVLASVATLPAQAIDVGKPFPELVLPALGDGRPLSIADFRGEKVILHVFASW